MTTRCETANDAIDALGGNTAFAQWWGAHTPYAVSNWRRRGFPPNTYEPMRRRLLTEKQIDAPASAWGMVDVPPDTDLAAQGAPAR